MLIKFISMFATKMVLILEKNKVYLCCFDDCYARMAYYQTCTFKVCGDVLSDILCRLEFIRV